jgi:hypothetical protein
MYYGNIFDNNRIVITEMNYIDWKINYLIIRLFKNIIFLFQV